VVDSLKLSFFTVPAQTIPGENFQRLNDFCHRWKAGFQSTQRNGKIMVLLYPVNTVSPGIITSKQTRQSISSSLTQMKTIKKKP
jgi:hypothetical protein